MITLLIILLCILIGFISLNVILHALKIIYIYVYITILISIIIMLLI